MDNEKIRQSGKQWHEEMTFTLMQDWLAHEGTDLTDETAVRNTLRGGGFSDGYIADYFRRTGAHAAA